MPCSSQLKGLVQSINEPKLTGPGCESTRRCMGWQMPRHILGHHLIIFLDSGYAYRSLSLSLSECWLSATVPRVTKEMLNVLIRSSEITKGAPAENSQSQTLPQKANGRPERRVFRISDMLSKWQNVRDWTTVGDVSEQKTSHGRDW